MIKTIIGTLLSLTLLTVLTMVGLQYEFLTKQYPKVLKLDKSATITITGPIRSVPLLFQLPDSPLKFPGQLRKSQYTDLKNEAKQVADMVREGKDLITLVINSPGGSLLLGNMFLSVVHSAKQLGVKFRCIVDTKAHSMALIILSHCDERLALFNSKLLWHSMAVTSQRPVNEARALELLDYMKIHNEKIWTSTRIHFFPTFFAEHFKKETYHSPADLEKYGFMFLRSIRAYEITETKQEK